MINISKEELQVALQQLDNALYYHRKWLEDITRTIICRLPYDHRDVAEDAHRQCRFGQWCYDQPPQALRDHPAFAALVIEHERMHELAARLLIGAAESAPGVSISYDSFTNALDRLHLEIESLKRELEDLLYNLDALTGAQNRVLMLTRLRELHQLVKRGVQQCSVAIMDMDDFKSINDNYGHPTGDRVLAGAVRHLMLNLRPYDSIYRYGGEEFLISLPNCDLKTAEEVIERLRKELAGLIDTSMGSIPATASFGITLLDPDVSVEESINRADTALLAAKKMGRNRICVWDSSMQAGQRAGG